MQRFLYFFVVLFVQILSIGNLAAQTEKEIPVPPYDLSDVYKLTLNQSEALKIDDENLKIADARYRESLSVLFPHVYLGAEYRRRDNADFGRVSSGSSNSTDDPATPIGGSGGSLGKTQSGTFVAVNQPIFHGFRDYLLSKAAKAETQVVRLQNERSRQIVYQDVADIFYQILFAEAEYKILEGTEKTLKRRMKELEEFITLGKSRESEVVAAQSDLEDFEATREQVKGLIDTSRELLAYLTGLPASQLNLKKEDIVPELKPLDAYLLPINNRRDIIANQFTIEAQQDRVTAARREHWPSVDFLGNAYGPEDPDRNRDWEMVLQFSLPLFEGGRIEAKTAAEEALLRSAQLSAAEQLRIADREVRVAYINSSSTSQQYKTLKKLKSTASKNYELQKKDYENGVVTNLEVLQAIRQLQEADRRLVRAEQAYLANLVRLEVAAGGPQL